MGVTADLEDPVTTASARLAKESTYSAYAAASNALDQEPAPGRKALKIGVLRNFTFEPVLPVLRGETATAGLHPLVHIGDFDAIAADALDPNSPLARFGADIFVLAVWLEPLAPLLVNRFASLSPDQIAAETARVVDFLRNVVAGIRQYSASPVLINNFPLPTRRALGILDAQIAESQTGAVLELNAQIRKLRDSFPNVFVVDYMTLFARLGADAIDERSWRSSRSPIGRRAVVAAGQEYGKYIRALAGRSRKCIVLDCDNTLWGGIIGEDGMAGIQLGETPAGSSYAAFQQELLGLYDRGILLALCSKNNEADVLEVFAKHPGMVLRDEHVVARRVNWEDKATNLEAIATELNIGLDSLVFVDDSPFECNLVRERLPQVEVIQLIGDPATYATQIEARGLFDSLVASREDKVRTALYKADAQRRELQSGSGSLEDYLKGLHMVAEVGRPNEATIQRVAQLTQKTNQFNLTTRRYTEDDIRRLEESGSAEVLYLRLRDKVADLGIIGVAITRYEGTVAEIDTLLLSCRALGRGAEQALVGEILRDARSRGATEIRASYIPTAKNAQVREFYDQLGFSLVESSDGVRRYHASPSHLDVRALFIDIQRQKSSK
ncbi:MAG TPA: HAD-IIIC family phosphatase [Gemmatimonadaceae bacterium]